MKIQIIKSMEDESGAKLPNRMIGNVYEVLKYDINGVWVEDLKMQTFILHDEYEIYNDSNDCETCEDIFYDEVYDRWVMKVNTWHWNEYYDDYVYQYINVNYCLRCGKKFKK